MVGGVGLSTRTVGVIMSTDGIIALMIQSIIFPVLAQYLGDVARRPGKAQ
jgi:hypothetical protein